MDIWLIIVVSLCVAAVFTPFLFRRSSGRLPPGPSVLHSNFLFLRNPLSGLEPILRNLKVKYGPIMTVSLGSSPSIFVANHSIAYQLLIQKGAVISDRPGTSPVRNIASAAYGVSWGLLRRNLASEMLNPSRVTSYDWARKLALKFLFARLHITDGTNLIEHFKYTVFCLMVSMCFGDKIDDHRISEIAAIQRRLMLLVGSGRFNVLRIFPRLGKILFRQRWKEVIRLRKDQEELLIPYIISRIESAQTPMGDMAYVDSLLKVELPEEDGVGGGRLTEKDIVSLCIEFLNSGTDTTATALEWILANLVKHPEIQKKLYDEIISVVGLPPPPPPAGAEPTSVIDGEKLMKMTYLKAVILEGLRRHPPGHFVLPHKVTKETEVHGFTIPQGATVNFMVAEIGLDPTVWDDPMEFKPERFLASNAMFDITGETGIKMMPFGAGKRSCPGSDLALHHLQYFVANLVWYFSWTPPAGYEVDLTEKAGFTTVMENPLQAQITSRKGSGPIFDFHMPRSVFVLGAGALISRLF